MSATIRLAPALAVASAGAFSVDARGQASGYCLRTNKIRMRHSFNMETGLEAAFGVSRPQLRDYLDDILMGWDSARIRQVTMVTDISPASDCEHWTNTSSCIGVYGANNAACGQTQNGAFVPSGVLAWGGCTGVRCAINFCPEQIFGASTLTSPSTWSVLVGHEHGHNIGLNHPDSTTPGDIDGSFCDLDSITTLETSNCSQAATAPGGCKSELMCASAGCSLSAPQDGDARGARLQHNGSTTTPLRIIGRASIPDTGVGLIPSVVFNTFTVDSASVSAAFPPRIDCVKGIGVINDCVMMRRTNTATPISLTRLRETSGTGSGWSSIADIGVSSMAVAFTPDIAISPDGTRGWVAVARGTQQGRLYVQEWNVDTGVLLRTISLDGAVDQDGILIGAIGRFPPRIVWSKALQGPVVFSAVQVAARPTSSFVGGDRLAAFWIRTSDGAVRPFPASSALSSQNPSGPFDIDCAPFNTFNGLPVDGCVLALPNRSATTHSHQLSFRQVQIRLPYQQHGETHPQIAVQSTGTTPHSYAFDSLLSAESVSLKSTGNLTATTPVYVSAIRAFRQGAGSNAKMFRGLGPTMSSLTEEPYTADMPTSSIQCQSAVSETNSSVVIPGFTPRRALPFSWCFDCNRLEGSVLRVDSSSPFCF